MANVVKFRDIYVRANPKDTKQLQYAKYLQGPWMKCYEFPTEIMALEVDDGNLFAVLINKTGYKAASGVMAFNRYYFSSGDKIYKAYFV